METDCKSNISLTNKILKGKNLSLTWDTNKRKKQSEIMKKLYAEGMVPGMSGKHHTEISKQQQSETRLKRKSELGYLNSPETRQKLRMINSGKNNPMFGVHKFGRDAPNYGKHHTKETKRKISLAGKGRITSEEARKKISEKLKGIPKSGEHKKNLSISHKGNIPWNKEKICPQLSGDKNPNWQNGKSFEPYTPEFNRLFKLAIKQRDNHSCLKCGLFEEDCKRLYGRPLGVHHIDYIKENTFKENCCCLCVRCNAEVNFNRPHWTKFFQSLLTERYDYQYDENQNIVLNLGVSTK